jgi:hypothetical protein
MRDTGQAPLDRHAKDVRDFWWHAAFYVIVNAVIIAQDLITGGGLDWAYWTFVPWGVGLLIHAIVVFFARNRRRLGTA